MATICHGAEGQTDKYRDEGGHSCLTLPTDVYAAMLMMLCLIHAWCCLAAKLHHVYQWMTTRPRIVALVAAAQLLTKVYAHIAAIHAHVQTLPCMIVCLGGRCTSNPTHGHLLLSCPAGCTRCGRCCSRSRTDTQLRARVCAPVHACVHACVHVCACVGSWA